MRFVNVTINYSAPSSIEEFVMRVGRIGNLTYITFVEATERAVVDYLTAYYRSMGQPIPHDLAALH
jgi:superfamily II DNA/RNA helicase